MKDQLLLFYVRGDILYPVALTEEQKVSFDMFMDMMPQPIQVVEDRPLGQVYTNKSKGAGSNA